MSDYHSLHHYSSSESINSQHQQAPLSQFQSTSFNPQLPTFPSYTTAASGSYYSLSSTSNPPSTTFSPPPRSPPYTVRESQTPTIPHFHPPPPRPIFSAHPPEFRQRQYSQPQAVPYPLDFHSPPPPPFDHSSTDLATLRSIQRQRKRELSGSTVSSGSNAPSSLLGFSGGILPSYQSSVQSGEGGGTPSPPLSSGQSTPHSYLEQSQAQGEFTQSSHRPPPPLPPPSHISSTQPQHQPYAFKPSQFHSLALHASTSTSNSTSTPTSFHLPHPPLSSRRSSFLNSLPPLPPSHPPSHHPIPSTSEPSSSEPDSSTSLTNPKLLPILQAGLSHRLTHQISPPPLSTRPPRSKAQSTSSQHGEGTLELPEISTEKPQQTGEENDDWLYQIGRNHQNKISSLELRIVCERCQVMPRKGRVGRVILRNLSKHLLTQLLILDELDPSDQPPISLSSPECLVCAGIVAENDGEVEGKKEMTKEERDKRERGYEDTLSAAIDRFEKLRLGGIKEEEKEDVEEEEEEWKKLRHCEVNEVGEVDLGRILKCDVCSMVCGVATLVESQESSNRSNSIGGAGGGGGLKKGKKSGREYTVEVVCERCDKLFRACSDCGSGGGRLTPGKWRCRELFPDGRKNCSLSHARNPTLDDISIVVNPVSSLTLPKLNEASSACRKLFFNTRLGTLCRPEFMLKGDGLASTYAQAERLSIDYWGRLNEVLTGDLPQGSTMVRYLVITYTHPRPRHPPRSKKNKNKKEDSEDDFDDEYDLGEPDYRPPSSLKRGSGRGNKSNVAANASAREGKKVPWAFSIVEVDYAVGVLFFCCVIPWATSGTSFDANSLLIERTNERVKSDLATLNSERKAQGLPSYPRLKYNFIVSPFRLDSKNSHNLNRRGFYTLDQLEANDEEGIDRSLFPPFRRIWLPAHYAKAMHVFVRKLEDDDDLGGPPAELAPRKRKKVLAAL